jgi:hypothetical protein
MTLGLLFWILMIIWLVFDLWSGYVPNQPYPVRAFGRSFLVLILFIILGWAVFGPPVSSNGPAYTPRVQVR